jgi:outer membrane cobalamin receptor
MHVPSVRSFLRFTSALVFAAGFATDASAAGDVAGRVVDPDGRPVAGARVLLSGAGVPLQSAITTEDGRFSIAAPETGRLTIRVAADGFRAEAVNVDGSAEPKDVGTIALAISALSESIVVSASQVEIPLTRVTSSVTIISGAELEARQIHTVADALRMVPGLTLASTGGLGTTSGVFPRGGESNFTLALIDGVPANSFGGDFDFSQVPTANIERIEVVRGPQSALFGANAIGAVVQIVSRRGGPPAAKLSVEGGHYGTSRVTTSTTGQHRGFEWGASYDGLGSDGFNGERTASGEEVVNDDYQRHAGAASGGWREGNFWVRADARHSTDERGFPGPFGSNPIGIYGGIDAVSRGTNDRTQASVSTSVPLSNRVRAQGLVGYNRLESDFTSQFDTSESFSRRWVGRMQADTALYSGLDLSAGVELQGERAGSTYITGSSFQQIPVERSTVGYFGEARWNWQDRVIVVTGLRIEDIRRDRIEESGTRPVLPSDTVVSVNPRASAAWITRGNTATYTKVRGGIGTGIRPPDGFELAFTDNPELRPERSFSVEAGVDQAFASGRGLVEATAFFNEYDDLIVAVGSFSGSSRYRTDNISNARARGLELALTLRGRIPGRRPIDLSGRVGYTHLATKILAVDQDDTAPPPFTVGQALLRRPDHQFFADFSASVASVSAFLRGGGRSAALDVEPSFGTFGGLFDASGYQVWHAGAAWRVARFAEVFGRVENLFDSSYEEAFGFPALGRRATAGLRLVAGH